MSNSIETKNGGSSSGGTWIMAPSETPQILGAEAELAHEDSDLAVPKNEKNHPRMGIEVLWRESSIYKYFPSGHYEGCRYTFIHKTSITLKSGVNHQFQQ